MAGDTTEPALLVWMLRRAARRFAGAMATALSAAGSGDLTPRGTWAVHTLHEGDRSAGELVEAMQISKQAVSTLVEDLVAKGYVERFPDDGDRRRTILRLTDRGVAAARVIEQNCLSVESEIEADLGTEEVSRLRRVLTTLGG
jgi:DNA-binding MarR family transcriptional regulator